jgi:hypothetical protein
MPADCSYFLPVSFLLFQLQYGETLNWSMPGLSNLPILAFALASLAALVRQGSASFVAACLFLVLAISAAGNGFALVPLGALLLWDRRQVLRATVWLSLGVLCAAGYFYRYDFQSSQQVAHGSVLNSVRFLNPLFSLAFMGSAVGNPRPFLQYLSVLVGAVILVIVAWMVKADYGQSNPTILSFTAFLALTAFGVSGFRGKLGFSASQASRYKIYSDLLLVCCYIFLVERYRRAPGAKVRQYFLVALVASGLFCGVFDVAGGRRLAVRRRQMVEGAAMYERSHHQFGPVVVDGSERTPTAAKINRWVQPIVQQSEVTGLYRFP